MRNVTAGSFAFLLALTLTLGGAPLSAQPANTSAVVLQRALAEPPASGDTFGRAVAFGDFDCDGLQDLAVGIPGYDVPDPAGPLTNAGAVRVYPGTSSGISGAGTTLVESDLAAAGAVSETDEEWGSRMVAGNFDGDEVEGHDCDDLAVSGTLETVGSVIEAGAVFVLYGDPAGLSTTRAQVWTQASAGVLDDPEPFDRFGTALAVGDFDGDGHDDLAIASHMENGDEGAVWALRGSATGLTSPDVGSGDDWMQLFSQDSPGMEDIGESDDEFGAALTACDVDADGFDDLAIGVPGEDIGFGETLIQDAGAFHVLFGSQDGLVIADNAFEPGGQEGGALGTALAGAELENGGFFDLGCEIAAGEPGATVFVSTPEGGIEVVEAGRVSLHQPQRGSTFGLVFGTFDKSDIPGELPDAGERFGEVLVAGDFDLDPDGLDDVLVGLFREGETTNDGALFWYTHRDRTGRGFRLGDLTTEPLIASGAGLGNQLAIGDLGGDGIPDLAAGLPALSRKIGPTIRDYVGAVLVVPAAPPFRDDFESGDLSAWSAAVPVP